MSLPSFDDIPSEPSATLTPARSSSGTGQMPLPSFMFEIGIVDDRPYLTSRDELDVVIGQPDPVLEVDARPEKAERVQVLGQGPAVHPPPRERLHARLEDVDVNRRGRARPRALRSR